jgi:hypothetical protein
VSDFIVVGAPHPRVGRDSKDNVPVIIEDLGDARNCFSLSLDVFQDVSGDYQREFSRQEIFSFGPTGVYYLRLWKSA